MQELIINQLAVYQKKKKESLTLNNKLFRARVEELEHIIAVLEKKLDQCKETLKKQHQLIAMLRPQG